jgi:maleylpyruvate isomerase
VDRSRAERELDEVIAGCAAAHQRLLADLEPLTDEEVAAPSELPGWAVGHVLAHLARHADSQARVLAAAAEGEPAERYPGGREQRSSEIEAGAARPAAEQVADIRRGIWALESAWATLPAAGWELAGTSLGAPEPVAELPFKRWREVEVHHADLGRPSFTVDDWADAYVRRELARAEMAWTARRPMGLTALPPAALALPPKRRLAWFMGRLTGDGLEPVPQWW